MYTNPIEECYNVNQVDNEQYQFEKEHKEIDEHMYEYMF